MRKLNLGCSDQQIAGYIGVDAWEPPWATPENFIKADLNGEWPFSDGSVDYIRAFDILEHLVSKIHSMNEIHRVLKPGGIVQIVVPTTDGRGAFQDPTHVSYWNRNSFFYHEHGNPHLERFKDAYGMRGGFKVAFEREQTLQDGVTKLHIVLEAVKIDSVMRQEEHPVADRPAVAERPDASGPKPAFSIIHTSARPNEWRNVYDAWLGAAANPEAVEYVLCVDARWGFVGTYFAELMAWESSRDGNKLVQNTGRRCYVDGVNLAAAASTGDVLIVNADDQYPCDKWDENLTEAYKQFACIENGQREADYVIEVSTNTPTEHERGILVMPILSRERYERFGWVFYPEYESMYADNDFCAMAKRDKCIIDARHLIFPHKHWINQQREKDEQDRAQNRDEAYDEGKKLFAARKRINFSGIPPKQEAPTPISDGKRQLVVIMTPGNVFSGVWLDAYTKLFGYIIPKYDVSTLRQYTSNAAITRTVMSRAILAMDYGKPVDFVLWIDDDNTLTPEQFETLVADLKAHPELDAVTGWCWTGADDNLEIGRATISCGQLIDTEPTEDGQDVKFTKIRQITPKEMYESPSDLIEIGYSGFPVVLMRFDLLKKVGEKLFTPFAEPRCEHGVSGEDIAFFARATIRSGARYAVDRRVKVPHLKLRPIEPIPTEEQVQEALRKTAAHMAAMK